MAIDVAYLIHEVYRQSLSKRVPPPFVTRVVKLVYLTDLEWHRRHGEQLSNVQWRFLHFGPYAYEFVPVLGNPDMELAEFEGKTARRFVFEPSQLEVSRVPDEVSQIIADLVMTWGNVGLNRLLDYIYFETEPMERARRGEPLDFSTVQPRVSEIPAKFDADKIAALRTRLRGQVARLGLSRKGTHIPAVDYQSQRAWDEESAPVLPVGLKVSRDLDGD